MLNMSEINKLPKEERGHQYRLLAKSSPDGNDEAAFKFAQLVYFGKYKPEKESGKTADTLKSEMNSDAVELILEACERGHLESLKFAMPAFFKGKEGGFGKVLWRVSYESARVVSGMLINKDGLDDELKAEALYTKAVCMQIALSRKKDEPDFDLDYEWQLIEQHLEDIIELGKPYTRKYEDSDNGIVDEITAKIADYSYNSAAIIGRYYFEQEQFTKAIPYLELSENYGFKTNTLLYLIYKNHIKDPEKEAFYLKLSKSHVEKSPKDTDD